MIDPNKLHKWMPPYHYDTEDFSEIRKAYDTIGGDIDAIQRAMSSRRAPVLWDNEDCIAFLTEFGMGADAQLSRDNLFNLRDMVLDLFRPPHVMNEEKFVKELRRVWKLPYNVDVYNREYISVATRDNPGKGEWTRSIPLASDLPNTFVTRAFWCKHATLTAPLTFKGASSSDNRVYTFSVSGDFRDWGMTEWLKQGVRFTSDLVANPYASTTPAYIPLSVNVSDKEIRLAFRLATDAAAKLIQKSRIILEKQTSGMGKLIGEFITVRDGEIRFGSKIGISNVTEGNVSGYNDYYERRELTEDNEVWSLRINPEWNISVRVSVPCEYADTSWNEGELGFDRLVVNIHNRFPAGVRLILDVHLRGTEQTIRIADVSQLTIQQDLDTGGQNRPSVTTETTFTTCTYNTPKRLVAEFDAGESTYTGYEPPPEEPWNGYTFDASTNTLKNAMWNDDEETLEVEDG